MLHPERKQAPELPGTPGVQRVAKARTQAEPDQIEPDPFMLGAAPPSPCALPQGIKQLAQHGRRPHHPVTEESLQLRAQLGHVFGIDLLLVRAKNAVCLVDGFGHADSQSPVFRRVAAGRVGTGHLLPQVKRQQPALARVRQADTMHFQCADFGERGCQLHRDVLPARRQRAGGHGGR